MSYPSFWMKSIFTDKKKEAPETQIQDPNVKGGSKQVTYVSILIH